VDAWLWIALISLAVLVIPFLAIRRAARNRVDPTEVSIDPAMAARVRELYAQGDKGSRLQAIKELRAATGLGLADAVRIADKLGPPKRS
jgi:ribosomal protein L7/L12